MSQRTRFFASVLLACLAHVTTAPLLLKWGLKCPARLAQQSLMEIGIPVSLVAIANAEKIEIPAKEPFPQHYPEQVKKHINEFPQEVLDPPYQESVKTIHSEESPQAHVEEPIENKLDIPNEETVSTNNQNTKKVDPPTITTEQKNRTDFLQKPSPSKFTAKQSPPMSAPIKIDTEPALISNPRPPYPAQARKNGLEGTVYIKISIDISGKISSASLLRSSGHQELDAAALKTVKEKWRFRPASASGLPVPSEKTIAVEFRLD